MNSTFWSDCDEAYFGINDNESKGLQMHGADFDICLSYADQVKAAHKTQRVEAVVIYNMADQ